MQHTMEGGNASYKYYPNHPLEMLVSVALERGGIPNLGASMQRLDGTDWALNFYRIPANSGFAAKPGEMISSFSVVPNPQECGGPMLGQ